MKLYETDIYPDGKATAIGSDGKVLASAVDVPVNSPNQSSAAADKFGYTYGSNLLKVLLPTSDAGNSQAYVLVFQTEISQDVSLQTSITNTITFKEDGTTVSERDATQVQVQEVTAIGGSYNGTLTVYKEDTAGNRLDGAVFRLLNKSGKPVQRWKGTAFADVTVGPAATNGAYTFTNLPDWAFRVEEVTPPNGYLLPSAPNRIHGGITGTKPTEWTTDPLKVFTNQPGNQDLEIYKQAGDGTALAGAKFTLTGLMYDGSTYTAEATSDASGVVRFLSVPMNYTKDAFYTIQEKEAPAGHLLSTAKIYSRVWYTDETARTASAVFWKTGSTWSTSPSSDVRTITNVPNPLGSSGTTNFSFTKTGVASLSMADAEFKLHRDSSPLSDPFSDQTANPNASGVVTFSGLTLGAYSIYETDTPNGYLKPNDSPSTKAILSLLIRYNTVADIPAAAPKTYLVAEMTAGSAPAGAFDAVSKTFKNAPAVADVEITKQSTAGAGVLVNGGTFRIQGKVVSGFPADITGGAIDGSDVYTATATAVNGKVIFKNVPVNAAGEEYTITELTPPSGYYPIQDAGKDSITVKVEYDDYTNKTAVLGPTFLTYTDNTRIASPAAAIFKNAPIPSSPAEGKASVFKKDETGAALAGADFTLFDKDGKAIASMTSGADGLAVFSGLIPGSDYTIRESKAPAGYALSSEVFSFTAASGITRSFTMLNQKIAVNAGVIAVLKTDPDGNPLSGAEFTLYDKDGNEVAALTTGADGKVSFEKLPAGQYTVAETRVPSGYVRTTGNQDVTLAKNETRSLTVVNETKPVIPTSVLGSIRLMKVNSDREPLSGAEFTLYAADGSVFAKATSGSNGLVVFTDLPIGAYTVRETAAPDGYHLIEDALSVTLPSSGATLSYTLKDAALDEEPEVAGWEEDGIPGKLPQTGGAAPSFFLLLTGIALVAIGFVWSRKGTYLPKHQKK